MQVRVARLEDYEAIRSLELRFGLESLSFEDFKALWCDNPCAAELPMGWILETPRKEVVGFLGNVPLLYELGERNIRAAATRAWVVEEPYRKYSILLLQNFLKQKTDLLLNTTANLEAQKIFDAFRIPRVPSADYDISLMRITNPAGFAHALTTMKGWPSFVALPLSALFFASSLLSKTLKQGSKVDLLSHFDERFDSFYKKLKSQNPEQLWACRNLRTLTWHFNAALKANRLWIFARTHGNEIQSYALFLRQDNAHFKLTRIRLVDFQSTLETTASLSDLHTFVAAAEQKCRSKKIHMIEVVGFPEKIRTALLKQGFRCRKLPAWMYFYKTTHPELALKLKDPHAWYACAYDGDASL